MIDAFIKNKTQAVLGTWNERLKRGGLEADRLLLFSFLCGVLACFCVALQTYLPALTLILFNRFFDSLAYTIENDKDRSQTRYLRRVFDIVFFGAFVFFFSLGSNGSSIAAALVLLTYLFMLATHHENVEKKGIEKSEIIIFMISCCLFSQAFSAISVVFGIICLVDSIYRFYNGTNA
jgi:hypothetical protein